MTTPRRPLYVVTVGPVEQVAAEPDTLAEFVEALRPHTQPAAGTAPAPLTGWPIVADPALPPGFVYLRPAPKEQHR
ncbi:hypothetical protein OG864_29805 [Streptomyces sp. NBC_00124]|uniref:hypothetical protein n=1 Tax=Streptomyces sp. NBC_00124 TaxID=2975662 RepID=UPI00224DEBED|nr:hypothetical protein [Streptomyces sp. NBC_00124]MCX5362897.1 hypothetical protein [Streptomyces sp. NBC_00124]